MISPASSVRPTLGNRSAQRRVERERRLGERHDRAVLDHGQHALPRRLRLVSDPTRQRMVGARTGTEPPVGARPMPPSRRGSSRTRSPPIDGTLCADLELPHQPQGALLSGRVPRNGARGSDVQQKEQRPPVQSLNHRRDPVLERRPVIHDRGKLSVGAKRSRATLTRN